VAPPAPAPADGGGVGGVGARSAPRGADLDSSLRSNKTDASRGTAASSVPAPAPVPAPVPTFAPAPTFAPPAESRWKLRTQPFLLLLRRMPVLCLGFQRHPVRIKEVLMIACCVLALRDTP
jgi:hypothetical protein